ncbi:MAG: peptide ABC transporter ATP-binding protein [Clostridium cadaveris]|uniref:Peptide ABC transporter ATP-binding protein n=1 Tax=Clostridium cadaveris TaxID=1529 RepID=A0A316M268_9CLOT|nr:MAG: peptide ABC transporter ATP-binding protein [Clostridium cadaveris]
MSLIELKNICRFYGKDDAQTKALNNVSLTIDSGEMVAIMGTSGSGKSTLLNIIGCLDKKTDGEYYFDDKRIDEYSKNDLAELRNSAFGFVVQYFALIDSYSVYENVEIPLVYNKTKISNKKERIKETLCKLGIEHKIHKHPNELSGGQCQRVAIARAIVNNPKVILADEPTGALDQKTGHEIMDILKKLNSQGKTIIIVTHDPNVAASCHRTIILEDGKLKNQETKLNS